MRFWNVNGFKSAAADVVRFLSDERCDVLVVVDSQLTDAETVRHVLPGWKMLHESRPHGTHKRRLFGGITVLWRPENTRVWREGGYAKGAVSFVAQDAAGLRRPVPVVALYSPPLTSRFNRAGKRWSDEVMDWVAVEQARLFVKYGFVVVGGDFNWRLLSSFRRSTEDVGEGSDASYRTQLARQWHLQTGLRPLYGQRGQPKGVCTSQTGNGSAEVDGVSVCAQLPSGWTAQALEVPEWECYSSHGGAHRPVGVTVFSPVVDVVPGGARENAAEASRGGAAGVGQKRVFPLPYGSAQYHVMSGAVADCIVGAAAQLTAGALDAAGALSAVAKGLVEIQNEYYVDAQGGGGDSKPRGLGNGTRAVTTLRHHRPPAPFRRLGSGVCVPPALAAQMATRRKAVTNLRRAKLELKRAGRHLSGAAGAQIQQRVEVAKAEMAAIDRDVRRHLSALDSKRVEAEAEQLAHLACANPARFHRMLRPRLPGEAGGYDESTGPSPEKCTEFRDFFATLLAKLRGGAGDRPPPVVVEEYAASVPGTDEATHAMLTAAVTWQEVYALLYPVHKLAVREPCLPDCKLCPLFAEHVEGYEPGNTHMAPPEHRPRLWTSKAAGPDGVLAETLRWACPEARAERHAYRRSVSAALASIFNAVVASGVVPASPQFADSAMTALYKGVGDRDAPTNYRGICVPNVLAKLFGLVLGTRLSHWAVVNGVISPAQAGFVVMHGCEYHILTLLETLRHRVRQGEDTVLVFLDFKKAYDSVSQPLAWEVLRRMGIPAEFTSLLQTWTAQSRISLRMGGATLEPFPQETGVPQGGVLSPVIFNLFIEVLLRHVNARAEELGVELSAADAARAGDKVPDALRLLALAYADDVVLICPSVEAAQEALRIVQQWAADFGMIVGVGQGKSMAMFVSAATVVQACKDDVNGMLKRSVAKAAAEAAAATDPDLNDDPAPSVDFESDSDSDSDSSTIYEDPDDEEWLPGDDPVVEAPAPAPPPLRRGQERVRGKIRGTGSKEPREYVPRPLPPLPKLPALRIALRAADGGDPVDVDVPWTSLYKYLGFMLRADLLDDHAYERIEKKTKATAERLLPHHRLVKAWPMGLKLQMLQTLVLSVTANVLPLLTSMRCASESKTVRLDQLRKKIALDILRLQGSARRAYVTAEAGLGDVMGDITQHRARLAGSLDLHPLKGLAAPPIACRVYDISYAEALVFNQRQHSLLLAPWAFINFKVVGGPEDTYRKADWPFPEMRCEVAPYASVVARVGERERWLTRMRQGMDWMCDSFALRPPPGPRRQTAALHWTSRLRCTDAGPIPKLTPLSYRGPRGSPIVSLSRRRSQLTSVVPSMRQGEASMQRFPFVPVERSAAKKKGAAAAAYRSKAWKRCHLCSDAAAPRYDLWHVLFDCPATREASAMGGARETCKAFVPQLCEFIEAAVVRNGESMSNTSKAGVSHSEILDAARDVRAALSGYNWDCIPGRWLIYTLLLAMPFPEVAVRPDAEQPVWLCPPKRKCKGVEPGRDLHGMPAEVPVLPDEQYALPEAVGRLFDRTILSRDALRPLADAWCRLSEGNLLRAGAVVRPLRAAAVARLALVGEDAPADDDVGSAAGSFAPSSDSEP